MFKILKNWTNYELICKKRDRHEPLRAELMDFKENPKFPKKTRCQDCGFEIELKIDEDDSGYYWVKEI